MARDLCLHPKIRQIPTEGRNISFDPGSFAEQPETYCSVQRAIESLDPLRPNIQPSKMIQ